ncbi:hypothetical protein LOS78_13210 [Paracoccus sp. MA]|uniref:hypothetical protein n=1 Tax=Paracoccus sp. MA TaxID=2895796 RepID=UPI001E3197DB|nr:hypothetical protein [Paracoccus sp. MA]UFM64636.1 hypothetical protein LOS78_13210 [Paracoccus sp. MA]
MRLGYAEPDRPRPKSLVDEVGGRRGALAPRLLGWCDKQQQIAGARVRIRHLFVSVLASHISQVEGEEMGQKFVPELHDPEYRQTEGQKFEKLTDDEAKSLFDAMVARLDAEERSDLRHN